MLQNAHSSKTKWRWFRATQPCKHDDIGCHKLLGNATEVSWNCAAMHHKQTIQKSEDSVPCNASAGTAMTASSTAFFDM